MKEVFHGDSSNDSAFVECLLGKVNKPLINFNMENNFEEILTKIENIGPEVTNKAVEVEETQKLSKFLINEHLSRGIQGHYKPLGEIACDGDKSYHQFARKSTF